MKSLLLSLTLVIGGFALPTSARQPEKFAVYYAASAPIEVLSPYGLLVLDSDAHPQLEPLLARQKMLLGYLSLGEVSTSRSYFHEVADNHLLIAENPNWQGSYTVDIRNPLWQKRVVEQLVPDILAQGFHGIFIDTLDTPIELEREYPKRYAGMGEAALRLIETLRLHYPQMKMMLNRAYPLLPRVAGTIDMVLGESIYASYDFAHKTYKPVEASLYQEQVRMLKAAQKLNPQLMVYTLDYCNKNDPKALTMIYQEQRKNGFIPYVATIGLDEIVAEPE